MPTIDTKTHIAQMYLSVMRPLRNVYMCNLNFSVDKRNTISQISEVTY